MPLSLEQVFEKVKADGDKELAYVFDDPVHYVVFNMKDFTFDLERVEQYIDILEEIDQSDGPGCMVTISTSPKIFSTGFSLPYWSQDVTHPFLSIGRFMYAMEKLATMSVPSLAVINGHGYAGGFILAILHDFQSLRAEGARMCLSEANVNSTLPLPYATACQEKLGNRVYNKLQYGIAIGAKEALADRVVDMIHASPEERQQQVATFVKTYAKYGKNRQITRENKHKINKVIIEGCRGPVLTPSEQARAIQNFQMAKTLFDMQARKKAAAGKPKL